MRLLFPVLYNIQSRFTSLNHYSFCTTSSSETQGQLMVGGEGEEEGESATGSPRMVPPKTRIRVLRNNSKYHTGYFFSSKHSLS